MNRVTRQTWRQSALILTMIASMLVGTIFGILGKNPFDPDNLFGKNPQNNSFLWISVIAFCITVVSSYTIWPFYKAEAARKDTSTNPRKSSSWLTNKYILKANRLSYLLFLPTVAVMQILRNLATLSNLEIFGWLNLVALLVFIVTDIVVLVLFFKGYRQRAEERAMR